MSQNGDSSLVELLKEWKYTIATSVVVAGGIYVGYRLLGSDNSTNKTPTLSSTASVDETTSAVDDTVQPRSVEVSLPSSQPLSPSWQWWNTSAVH